jgi:hypothetical protein
MGEEKTTPSVQMPFQLSPTMLLMVGAVAILLVFIGATLGVYADSQGSYQTGLLLMNLGMLALGGGLFAGALTTEGLDSRLRMGMVIAAGFIVAWGFAYSGRLY